MSIDHRAHTTRRSRRLLAVCAALAAGLLAPPLASAASTIPDAGIRVKAGPPGDLCAEVRLAAQAGIPWVSYGSGWEGLEPSPGDYRDPATERAILTCAKDLGLKTQLILTGSPPWASGRSGGNDPPTPANVPAYGAFLSQLAGRIGPLVDVWTPWNEPNINLFWAPPQDVPRYVGIQKTAYAALKGADPGSLVSAAPVVGSGGAATDAWDFIEQAYAAGLKGSADLILLNLFPSGPPERTSVDSRGRPSPWVISSQPYLRALVDRFDPGRPLWITEISYSTCTCSYIPGNVVSEAVQADYLVRIFAYRRRYLQDITSRIFWYEMRDSGANRSDWFQTQGLVRNDFSPKPAFTALASLRSEQPGGPGSGGGGPSLTALPPAAAKPPAPAARTTAAGIRLALGRPRIKLRRGRITLTVGATVSRGVGILRVQGYRRRAWRPIATARVRGTSKVTIRFTDKGYLGLRVLLGTPGQGIRSGVARVVRLPRQAR